MNRISEAVKKAVHKVQISYKKEKRALAWDTEKRNKRAETKREKEILKANAELKRLQLERRMYEAKAAVINEKVRLHRVKRSVSGTGTAVRSYGSGFEQFTKGLGSNKARRKSVDRTRRSPKSK